MNKVTRADVEVFPIKRDRDLQIACWIVDSTCTVSEL